MGGDLVRTIAIGISLTLPSGGSFTFTGTSLNITVAKYDSSTWPIHIS